MVSLRHVLREASGRCPDPWAGVRQEFWERNMGTIFYFKWGDVGVGGIWNCSHLA